MKTHIHFKQNQNQIGFHTGWDIGYFILDPIILDFILRSYL